MNIDYRSIPLGAQKSPPDERDWQVSKLVPRAVEVFPDAYEIPYLHEIKSQGAVGSCVAHALTYCREIIEEKQSGEYTKLSPGFIYGMRNQGDYEGTGMIPRQALKELLDYGICDYKSFPYNLEWPEIKGVITPEKDRLLPNAYLHRITAYANLTSVEDIKTALLNLGPVPVMIPIYTSFYKVTKSSPIVPIPDTSKEKLEGFHEVTIIGWRANNTWIVLNSWGSDWGDNGKFYIPINSDLVMEAWAITDKVIPGRDDTMDIRPCKITMADYHHTAGNEKNAEDIRKEHRAKGWGDIGYNMVILPDGSIEWGRDIKYSGAHDPGSAPDGSGYTMNQRAYGIVCIGNFDEKEMSEAQYQGLLKGALWVHNEFGLKLTDHHRHRDQYSTECPGDYFPWDRLMTDLKNEIEGVDDVLEVAILKHSAEDEWAAKDIDAQLGGVANFTRQGSARVIPAAALKAKKLIIIGGPDVPEHPNRVYLSGNTKYDTAAAVGKYLG